MRTDIRPVFQSAGLPEVIKPRAEAQGLRSWVVQNLETGFPWFMATKEHAEEKAEEVGNCQIWPPVQ